MTCGSYPIRRVERPGSRRWFGASATILTSKQPEQTVYKVAFLFWSKWSVLLRTVFEVRWGELFARSVSLTFSIIGLVRSPPFRSIRTSTQEIRPVLASSRRIFQCPCYRSATGKSNPKPYTSDATQSRWPFRTSFTPNDSFTNAPWIRFCDRLFVSINSFHRTMRTWSSTTSCRVAITYCTLRTKRWSAICQRSWGRCVSFSASRTANRSWNCCTSIFPSSRYATIRRLIVKNRMIQSRKHHSYAKAKRMVGNTN